MKPSTPIDWAKARRRLSELDIAIQEVSAPSAERTRQLLEDRATALAKALPVSPGALDDGQALVFSLAGRRLALETRYAREVIRAPEVTPIPRASRLLAGIANLRGELLPIFDLRDFFGFRHEKETVFDWAVICGEDRADFVILVDEAEILSIQPDEILDLPATAEEAVTGCLRGITRAGVTILDAKTFFAHPMLFPKSVQGQNRLTSLEV